MKKKYTDNDNSSLDRIIDDFIDDEFSKLDNPFEQSEMPFGDDDDAPAEVAKPEPIGVKRCKPFFYNSSAISVSLCLTRKLNADDRITVKCHNSCYLPMGEVSISGKDAIDDRPYAKGIIHSDYMWLPDVYHFVAYSGDKPIDAFSFAFNGEAFQRRDYHPVTPQSAESVIANAGFQATSWNLLRLAPGTRGIIDSLIEHTKLHLLNEWRREHDLTTISLCNHFAVIGGSWRVTTLLPRLFCPGFAVTKADCNEICEPKMTNAPYDEASSIFDSIDGKVIVLSNISALITPAGAPVAQMLIKCLTSGSPRFAIILSGSRQEVDNLFAAYPAIADCIPSEHRLVCKITGSNELVHFVHTYFHRHHFSLSPDARKCVCHMVERDYGSLMLCNDVVQHIVDVLAQVISGNVSRRMFGSFSDSIADKKFYLSTIEASDFDGVSFAPQYESFARCMGELEQLVGLTELKQSLATALNKMKFTAMRREAGFATGKAMANHIIFTGNPGTGKTTVATMIGKVFHSLGLLSKGDVVMTERSKLVGRYIGDTEKNVLDVLNQARGNVLFIDEAYNLYTGNSDDRKDFGWRVIESLLTVLSQPDPDMVVIFAGYEKEMDEMMKMNPGLEGRFAHHFRFPDYDASELCTIAERLLKKWDYRLDADAHEALRREISCAVAHKDRTFSNARWVSNFVENGIISSVANRLAARFADDAAGVTADELCTIHACDISAAAVAVSHGSAATQRRRIGFAIPLS
ncbi:MAG: AAA family ATPase [Muribaculaceae bacterium]